MLETGFYALTILIILMVLAVLKYYAAPKDITFKYLLVILVWTIYIIVISSADLLNNFDLPPRVPLLIVLPAIFIIFIVTGGKGMRTVVQKTPIYLPVFFQSFRILVELLIYGAFLEGIFPKRATFEGLNFDILVGISAVLIGLAALRGAISLKGLMIWNILSLCILAVTVYSFVSAYYFTDFVRTGVGRKLIEFPYLLLPAYLLPMAVFLHIFSIRQILFKVKNRA